MRADQIAQCCTPKARGADHRVGSAESSELATCDARVSTEFE